VFGDTLGGDAVEMKVASSGLDPPNVGSGSMWQFWCRDAWASVYVVLEDQPVVCTECGQNKFTPPGSNTCQCRIGQTPGLDGACTACLADTFKPEPSNGACTLCPQNSSSAVGSSAITACACNTGFSGEDGGECTACASGKRSVVT